MTEENINETAADNGLSSDDFHDNYIVVPENQGGICLFRAIYSRTDPSRPPDDGKLRELKPDLFWRSVFGQHILPKPGNWDYAPLQHNIIYS